MLSSALMSEKSAQNLITAQTTVGGWKSAGAFREAMGLQSSRWVTKLLNKNLDGSTQSLQATGTKEMSAERGRTSRTCCYKGISSGV